MPNEFLENALQKGMAGTTVGGAAAGPWGALAGASVGVLSAAAQSIMGLGDQWKADTLQQQQILNRMIADGYDVVGKVPEQLKLPEGYQYKSGMEASINPKPQIHFNQKTGMPALHVRQTAETRPSTLNNLPLPQGKSGGLGIEAEVNPEGLKELNARYYAGESGFNPQSILYPGIKNPGQEGFDPNAGTGSFGTPEELNRNIPQTAQQNRLNESNNTNGHFQNSGPNVSSSSNAYSQNSGPNVPKGGYWEGKKEFNEQIPRYTPFEQEYRNQNIRNLMQNKGDFGPIEREELRRFKEETAPQLAQQYFGNNPSSFGSAYPEALGRGGANLGSKLAAMKAQYEADREGRQMALAKEPTFDTYKHPAEPGVVEKLANKFGPEEFSLLGEGVNKAGQWIRNKWNQSEQAPQESGQQPMTTNGQVTANGQVYRPEELSQLSSDFKNPGALQDLFRKKFQQDLEQKNFRTGGRSF